MQVRFYKHYLLFIIQTYKSATEAHVIQTRKLAHSVLYCVTFVCVLSATCRPAGSCALFKIGLKGL